MKLLLDTHVWLWGLLEPERLAPSVRAALEAPDNEIWLSPISVWEAHLLAERGRLGVPADLDGWIHEMIRATPRREAPLTHAVALQSRRLTLPHRDPADRFIAATANVYDLMLVTADERLLEGKGYRVMGVT